MKQILITVLAVVAIIGGAILLSGGDDNAVGAESNNFYGQEEGVITLTEYGDFQCPACAGFFSIVSQVKEEFKDQIRFEFKHFPLVQIHPNAMPAHRAAQAAANQGMFWEMHDRLYGEQQSWSSSSNPASVFEQYAREIGLDMDQYTSEVNTSEVLGVINADIDAGKDLGANSTPTFAVDGVVVEDTSSLSTVEGFSQFIQDKIDEKNGTSTEQSDSEITEEDHSEHSEEATKPEDQEVE